MKTLTLYDTKSKSKKEFVSLKKNEVSMYVCGPTVYDQLHIGNFRGAIFFNFVREQLEFLGYKVSYVYNFTDVDDKIIKRANEMGIRIDELTKQTIQQFQADFNTLGLREHSHNPTCTGYMQKIIDYVEELVDAGFAYEANAHVFFDINKLDSYGSLSHKSIEDLEVGHRVDPAPGKKNPLDFVLWKPAKADEPKWESPWGAGRPGWHIECSVMAKSLLGEQIDIHGGGIDLIFPHHESAQLECISKKNFVQTWMHHNFVLLNNNKMSKSLGNIISAASFLEKYNAELLKYFMLSSHYRSLLHLNDETLTHSIKALHRIYTCLTRLKNQADDSVPLDQKHDTFLAEKNQAFEDALLDDLNTPAAFSQLFEVIRYTNQELDTKPQSALSKRVLTWLQDKGKRFALFQEKPNAFLDELSTIFLTENNLKKEDINHLIQKRQDARKNKEFSTADAIRDELTQKGILLKDEATKTTWHVNFEALKSAP